MAAVFPVFLFAQYVAVFPVVDLLRPALILAGVFALILLLAKVLLRDWHRAGLLTTCLIIVLIAATQHFAIVGILAAATLLIVALDKGKMSATGTILMNIFVATQMLAALITISPALLIGGGIKLRDDSLNAVELRQRPSIIHIVLDGYSSREVLSQVYAYDNSAFEDALAQQGFAVMQQAFTPHNQTLFAMASVFSAAYVRPADLPDINRKRLHLKLGKAISGGAVPELLRKEGYQFAYSDTSYGPFHSSAGTLRVSKGAFTLNSVESSLVSSVWPVDRRGILTPLVG